MAQARNYQEQDAGSSLDDDIERCREEFEVEICRSNGDLESDLHRRTTECRKNPGHVDFIPEPEFTIEHLPVEWRDPLVYKIIRAKARRSVHLSVSYTSPKRPDGYLDSKIRGLKLVRYGTGYAYFPSDYQNRQPQQCPFKDCKVSHPHNVTPEFYVDTASHVVFDLSEAEQTEIRFFFDSEDDTKGKAKITAQGLHIFESTGTFGEICTFTCVSHNLNIRDLCLSDTEEGALEPTSSAFDTDEKKPEPQFSPTGTKEKIPEQPSSFLNREEKKPEQPLGPQHTEEKTHDPPLSPTEEKKPEPPSCPTEEKTSEPPSNPTEEKTPELPLRDTNSKTKKPLVVIISHPHGCSKHVSTGYWTGVKSVLSRYFKLVGDITLRKFTELLRLVGLPPEFLELAGIPLDTTIKQNYQNHNISPRDSLVNSSHDLALISANPFTVKEIVYKMLFAMWEKTTSNSTLSGQVSEEELSEIALSVVNDITSLKSSLWKKWICKIVLQMWIKLTSDSRFGRQICRKEFNEICTNVVNDIFENSPLRFITEIVNRISSLLSMPVDTFWKVLPISSSFYVDPEVDDEAHPLRNMTLGQALQSFTDEVLENPDFVGNIYDRMLYSTPTCPASSGAPVLLFYEKDNGEVDLEISTHVGASKTTNMSGMAPSMSTLFEKVKENIGRPKKKVIQDDIPLD